MEDERGPGLDFSLCFVYGSRPRGAAAFLLCLVILLLKCLNVRRFPPPSSRIYQLRYSGVCSDVVLGRMRLASLPVGDFFFFFKPFKPRECLTLSCCIS